MKTAILIAAAFMSLGLMGCKEQKSPPKRAIQESLKLLNENRIAEFRSSLTGAASQQMASDRNVEILKNKVSQLGQMDLGNENVTSSSGSGGSSTVNYRIDVKSGKDVVGNIEVLCRTDYREWEERVCVKERPINNGGGSSNDDREPNPPRYDGRNDNNGRDDRDRDHDGGHVIPGDSNPKEDPNDNRDPNRPPRFPPPHSVEMIGFSYQTMNYGNERCHYETRRDSSTVCKVSQINF